MTIHEPKTFIKQYSPGDELIFIQDVNEIITYEIKPWHVNSLYVLPSSRSIIIKLKGSDYTPKISFTKHSLALESLTLLQTSIDLAKGVIDNVPSEIKNYIDNRITIVIESGKYTFRQLLPSENWYITKHAMNKKPSVTITDNNFVEIEGFVQYIDNDNIDIKFNVPLNGWVFLS